MAEKNLNARIVHKHDIEENWSLATNFIPKQGEIIVYDVDDNYAYERIKIGDGETNVNLLPFCGAQVQSDWNQNNEYADDYIKNKPFGESYYIERTGDETVTVAGTNYTYTLVSNEILELEELEGAIAYFSGGGSAVNTYKFSEDLYGGMSSALVVKTAGASSSLIGSNSFPEPGIYFASNASRTITSLMIQVKKIPDRYMYNKYVTEADLVPISTATDWINIYDSGEITSEVNSIAGIDVAGYKSLMVVVKCVNTTNTNSTRAGAVIFTGTNSQDYAFNNIFSNLLKNGTTTSGAFAKFKVVDNYIICESAMRSINASNILSEDEGVGFDQLAPLAGGLIKCTTPLSTMAVSSANQSEQHFYGVGSRVIVWGCVV